VVEGDQRSSELTREAVMFDVARATEIFVLEHEKHIPPEAGPHVLHYAARNVRVGIHARVGKSRRMWREL
jgi:hypothetical protein